MSQRIETGGPAFPRPASEDTHNGTLADGNNVEIAQDGMTLRDYFAAKAMQSIIANLRTDLEPAKTLQDYSKIITENAYMMADAMLKVRST